MFTGPFFLIGRRMLGPALKRPSFAVALCVAAFILALVFAQTGSGAPRTFKLSGRVLRSSEKYVVYVALWRAADFLRQPVQQVRIEPRVDRIFQFEVTAGRWAVSAFEDRNGNAVLDMGLFGPKEPSGFWHPFTGWHKPRFNEVASLIEQDTTDADITLK